MLLPKDSHILIAGTCTFVVLCGKGDCIDVTSEGPKDVILDDPGWGGGEKVGVGLNHKGLCKREAGRSQLEREIRR